MLRILREGQRWIMGIVILIVGGVFVFFIGVGAPLRRGARAEHDVVVQVEEQQFGRREVERVRARQEEQLKRQLGAQYDPKLLEERVDLDAIAASQLVQLSLLAQEGERLGLRATDDELRDIVRRNFQDEQGKVSLEQYKRYYEYEYGTERLFLQDLRMQILAQKTLALLGEGASVSDTEAKDSLRQRLETVKLAYVAVDTTQLPPGYEIADAQVDGLLASDEPRVKKFYDDNPQRFHTPERVRARHVLLRVPKDATPEQTAAIEKRMADVRARLEKGEDFAKVAAETSEDPGSKDRGGDLGFFGRGQMVPAFEAAAFALEPGGLSPVVRTDFGFHVIRVEEKAPASDRSYEDAKREIARELVTLDVAKTEARKRADAISAAVRAGKSVEQAAREERLTLERTDALHRRPDGFVAGLGAVPELLDVAFALPSEAPSSARIFDVGQKLVLVQVLEHTRPTDDEIAKELPAEKRRLASEKRQLAQQGWVEARRKELEAAGRIHIDLAQLGPRHAAQ
ncbi:MAG TPA: peptidylprolyl isomerase [Myxococcota bacterium]|jgi:peptidyl-prolyl cis-trans isomerase D|nr:peptidylprolyl isomerase [Myxococcota bacterium]